MKVKIIAFGIATDILNNREMNLEIKEGATVADIKAKLEEDFPKFKDLASLSLAVGEEYREDDFVVTAHQEVVIIPPVAGG